MFEHRRKLSQENEKLLVDYVDHLKKAIGLAKGTIYNRIYSARTFLAIQEEKGHADVTKLRPDDVRDYVMREADRYERSTLGNVRNTLKSLFNYLHMKGLMEKIMLEAIPEMPHWSLSEIPEHLTKEQTDKLLGSFNRQCTEGKRNYAIAMILVHLGLRSCEVAAMEVGDIDWESGILHVRNLKCRRRDQLPLPKEVGEAIVDYIKNGRGKSKVKQIFLCHRANKLDKAMSPKTIQVGMTYRFKKHEMKMAQYGTHIIRRTVAGLMLLRLRRTTLFKT